MLAKRATKQLQVQVLSERSARVGLELDGSLYLAGYELTRWHGKSKANVCALAKQESVATGCVHDGEIWLAGNQVYRCTPTGKRIDVAVEKHPDVGGLSYDPAFRALAAHAGELWMAGRKGAVLRLDGKTFRHVVSVPDTVFGLTSHDGALWLAVGKGGLLRMEDGRTAPTSLRANKLHQVFVSSSGAMLVVGRGTNHGIVHRQSPGAKKFTPTRLPKDGYISQLCQLPSGRIVGAGYWGLVFVSDDDGQSFTKLVGSNARVAAALPKASFEFAVTVGDRAYLGGVATPLVAVAD